MNSAKIKIFNAILEKLRDTAAQYNSINDARQVLLENKEDTLALFYKMLGAKELFCDIIEDLKEIKVDIENEI